VQKSFIENYIASIEGISTTEQLSELQFFEFLTRTPEYTISVTKN
jgi:hypothetical protein